MFIVIAFENMANWERVKWKFSSQDILKTRVIIRETLLGKKKGLKHDDRVSFNVKCYAILNVIKNIRNVFKELHILLAPDEQHK